MGDRLVASICVRLTGLPMYIFALLSPLGLLCVAPALFGPFGFGHVVSKTPLLAHLGFPCVASALVSPFGFPCVAPALCSVATAFVNP